METYLYHVLLAYPREVQAENDASVDTYCESVRARCPETAVALVRHMAWRANPDFQPAAFEVLLVVEGGVIAG